MRTAAEVAVVAALAIVVTLATACSEAPDPDPPPAFAFAGTYVTQYRFGGINGTWYANLDVRITGQTDPVYWGTTPILRPRIGANTLSWTIEDGNPHNVDVTFVTSSTNAYYWGPGGHTGLAFEGAIQYPGSGPEDFRGAVR